MKLTRVGVLGAKPRAHRLQQQVPKSVWRGRRIVGDVLTFTPGDIVELGIEALGQRQRLVEAHG